MELIKNAHALYRDNGPLKGIFLKSKYPEKFIDSTINCLQHPTDPVRTSPDSPVRITLPFKDQKSAYVVRRQLGDL